MPGLSAQLPGQWFMRNFSKPTKSRSCGHFDVAPPSGIASARSSSSGKVPLVFSDDLKIEREIALKGGPTVNIFAKRGCRRGAYSLGGRRRAPRKKNAFSRQNFRSRDPDIFFRKKMVGRSFHVILMQARARTERVAVAGLEKMLTKVPWALGDVA